MTVAELVAALKTQPQTAPVLLEILDPVWGSVSHHVPVLGLLLADHQPPRSPRDRPPPAGAVVLQGPR